MAVRKRVWENRDGSQGEAYLVDYRDRDGVRRYKAFPRKRDADLYAGEIKIAVRRGVHVANGDGRTVEEAGRLWLEHVALEGRERSTLQQYASHVRLHIDPLMVGDDESGYVRLGGIKLADLTTPFIAEVRTALLRKLNKPTAKKALVTFKALISFAQIQGHIATNPATPLSIKMDGRDKRKLEVGRDIPTRAEVSALIAHAGNVRTMLVVAAFVGLRVSEIRGLRESDVDFRQGRLSVRQRVDRFGATGRPKTKSSERDIPVDPFTLHVLREWMAQRPKGEGDFLFPGLKGRGALGYLAAHRRFRRTQVEAGIAPSLAQPKYGWHSLRHFYASLLINRRVDGGLELPLKTVSEFMGHSSIKQTADVYGHLFPSQDDGAALAAAVRAVVDLAGVRRQN